MAGATMIVRAANGLVASESIVERRAAFFSAGAGAGLTGRDFGASISLF
jgi:hypothetical protein